MNRLLALMFAIALSVSMSSFAFARGIAGDNPFDQKQENQAKHHHKHHKRHKKAETTRETR